MMWRKTRKEARYDIKKKGRRVAKGKTEKRTPRRKGMGKREEKMITS